MRKIIFTLFVFLLVNRAYGQTTSPVGEVHEFFNGARSLAMGGTSIAVVNDETALLVNPAGLGKVRDFYGTVLDPELDLSNSMSAQYKSKPSGALFDPAAVQKILDSQRETYYHARAQVFPSMVVRNFGIGFFVRNSLDAYVDATGAKMQTYYLNDYALLLGYNLRLFDGRLKIGVVGKAISRIQIDNSLDTTAALGVGSNASEGAGLGGDAGVTLTAPWAWLPTLSAVMRDVGGTSFQAGSGLRMSTATRPATLTQDLDVAIALFPIHANKSRSAFSVEYQKMTEASKATDKTRYLHVGYEFNYADLLFIRLGQNQRYWTAGIELASERTQIQITTYGEDVGVDGTPLEDRRTVFKFSFRF